MSRDININLTFMSRWWNKHFYSIFAKPLVASDDEFERVSLQRQRFLFERFGEFGIGEEHPVSDGKYVNVIMKWCVDFIPYLLGVKLKCLNEGFWSAEALSEEEIIKLKPVDISTHPFSEWILQRKETLVKRYGKAENGQLVEGSINAASRIRGDELYYDLIANKELATHLLDVITETLILTHKFFAGEFELQQILLANCTNTHIGPELYEEMALGIDIRVAEETRSLFEKEKFIYIHNCDSSADKFIHLYNQVPYLDKLDGADTTDIKRVKSMMKDVKFTAFINPVIIQQSTPVQIHERITRDLLDGADEFLIANIDPITDISDVKELLRTITNCCAELKLNPRFSVTPFTEDEYEWSFPMYQGHGIYHCGDDWHSLIPKP